MFKRKKDIRIIMLLIVFTCFVVSVFMRPQFYADVISYIWGVLSVIIAGLCVAFILNLVLVPIEKKIIAPLFKKHPRPVLMRTLGIVITMIVALGMVALALMSIVPAVEGLVELVSENLPSLVDSLPGRVTGFLSRLGLTTDKLREFGEKTAESATALPRMLQESLGSTVTFAFNLTTGIFSGIVNVILTFAIAVYALGCKERLSEATEKLVRATLRQRAAGVFHDLQELMFDKFSEFFKGQIIEAVILGVMCFIGMLVFGFPNAGSVSVLVAICAVVPIIGPWVGSITGTLLVLLTNPLKGLLFAIFILVLQQVEDNVVYPKIVGKSMGVPGLLVICAVVIGMEIAGMMGIIIAVPLSAVIFELVNKYVTLKPVRSEKRMLDNLVDEAKPQEEAEQTEEDA